MSDELKVGYGRFDPNPQPLTPGQSKILDALKALPLATFAERREAEIATLRTQLAAMTAERDELQTSMDELRKACAEVIGADPQTWPDHGNAPLAIAASLGLRSIELDRATAERDNWKETSVTIAGELADTKDERDAAMAKEVVLRDCGMRWWNRSTR